MYYFGSLTVVLIITGTVFIYFKSRPSLTPRSNEASDQVAVNNSTLIDPTPPPPPRTPIPLIPDQETAGTFMVSQGSRTGPRFKEVVIDPLDPKINDTVTITTKLTHPTPIESVVATLFTDIGNQKIIFSRLSSDNQAEEVWEAKFELTQTVLFTYKLHFSSGASDGTSMFDMALRQ